MKISNLLSRLLKTAALEEALKAKTATEHIREEIKKALKSTGSRKS